MIYLLFGEMGVGKNYVGERLARHLGCPFFDGDDAIPEWMWRTIRRFVPPTLPEINRYIHENLIPAIRNRVLDHDRETGYMRSDLIVAQALYRRRHRKLIIDHMERCGIPVRTIWLAPPSFLVHARRLLSRKKGWRWLLYSLMCKPFFQKPDPLDRRTHKIVNRTGCDPFWELIK